MHRLSDLCQEADIWATTGPGDASILSRRAVDQGYSIIVAAGGDGTINEVVNGIAESSAILGILPAGTINVFASELGIPHNLEAAWEIILEGNVRSIDLPSCNGHHFVQLAGAGLDAQVVEETPWASKKKFGPLSYFMTLMQIASRPSPKIQLTTDTGATYEGSFLLVGNGRYYGGPLKVFKRAHLQDGLLDVCLFRKTDHGSLLRYSQEILFGTHVNDPEITYFQCRTLRAESDQSVPVEVDGELYGHLPCEFRMEPQKLKVLVPLVEE